MKTLKQRLEYWLILKYKNENYMNTTKDEKGKQIANLRRIEIEERINQLKQLLRELEGE